MHDQKHPACLIQVIASIDTVFAIRLRWHFLLINPATGRIQLIFLGFNTVDMVHEGAWVLRGFPIKVIFSRVVFRCWVFDDTTTFYSWPHRPWTMVGSLDQLFRNTLTELHANDIWKKIDDHPSTLSSFWPKLTQMFLCCIYNNHLNWVSYGWVAEERSALDPGIGDPDRLFTDACGGSRRFLEQSVIHLEKSNCKRHRFRSGRCCFCWSVGCRSVMIVHYPISRTEETISVHSRGNFPPRLRPECFSSGRTDLQRGRIRSIDHTYDRPDL